MKDLSDKTVLAVGVGSGIGKAVAHMACDQNATVIISSRSESKLRRTATSISAGIQISTVDMTDESAVRSWARQLPDIDYLVISASTAAHGPFATSPTAPLRAMFDA